MVAAKKIKKKVQPTIKAQSEKPSNINNKKIKKPLDPEKMEVVDQMVYMLSKAPGKNGSRKHLAAGLLGFILGGIMPIGSYSIAHIELSNVDNYLTNIATYKLIGCLLYSSPTVYQWAKTAFGSDTFIGKLKPFGFVLGLEGIMVSSYEHWFVHALSICCLCLLVFINGVASACKLALKRTVQDVT